MRSMPFLAARLFLAAGLLLPLTGPLTLPGASAAGNNAQPNTPARQAAEVLGFFEASAPAAAAPAQAALALPRAPVGDYSEVTRLDPATHALATDISGVITTTTTWTLANSPFTVVGDITVQTGVTLTVEPGVVVNFEEGRTLLINGRLLAEGTAQQPITFTLASNETGYWSGLLFASTTASPISGSRLHHVTVSNGGYFGGSPGAIHLFRAEVDIAHATIANSQYNGVYGGENGVAHLTDVTLTNNGTATPATDDYAVWFTDGSVSPNLSDLTLTGNSQNAIALGGGTLSTRTWKALGYPYILTQNQIVPYGSTLTVEAGTEVKVRGTFSILVQGRLEALGGVTAPITFTAFTPTPGAWNGLLFDGAPGQPAVGVLDYTTVEYGGFCGSCANVFSTYAQVNFSHGKLRHSSKAGALAGEQGAAGLVIEHTQFVGNLGNGGSATGVQNSDPSGSVLATNNWWGHASGPVAPNNCNLGGSGQSVSARVAFLPFLTTPDSPPDAVTATGLLTLSLNPLRYYAPADGQTQVWFEITLRDGAGAPVAGQTVQLHTSLGTATAGGTTDAAGKSFAFVTSNTPGEATVFAQLNGLTACQFARSSVTDITFGPTGADPLSPDAQSPYSNAGVEFDPQPVQVGVPGVLRVRLHNPNNFAITVDATFSFAQLGLGLLFGPVGSVNDVVIPPQSDGVLELDWVPLVTGHFCIQVNYTWEPVAGAAIAGDVAGPSAVQANGRTQSNTAGAPAPMLRDFDKTAIRRASVATTSLGDISFAAAGLDDIAATGSPAASAPVGWLQGIMVGNILDFIFEGGGGIDCAMDGGTSCGGWKGPRMHYPGESFGNLAGDPPSPDYRELVPVETLTFPPAVPGGDVSPAQAAALNELIRAGLDVSSYLTAAVASYDRYSGAVAANETGWATQHANAFSFYLKEGALRMDDLADKMEALVDVLHAEGHQLLLAEQDFADYQQRLISQGFTAQEIEAARLTGKTDEGIELSRLRRIALDPAEVSGWFDEKMLAAAAAFRQLSLELTAVPMFGGSTGSPGLAAATADDDPNLLRTGEPAYQFQVGNPYTNTTITVDLKVRRIDVPSDWIFELSHTSVQLAPEEQITVTVTARPGLPGIQGTLPRFAVEGFENGTLLGGVEFQVYLPEEQPFLGADRLFLPLVRRQP